MSRSEKEKRVQKALRMLTIAFQESLDPEYARNHLYARGQLTWMEYQRISTFGGVGGWGVW